MQGETPAKMHVSEPDRTSSCEVHETVRYEHAILPTMQTAKLELQCLRNYEGVKPILGKAARVLKTDLRIVNIA